MTASAWTIKKSGSSVSFWNISVNFTVVLWLGLNNVSHSSLTVRSNLYYFHLESLLCQVTNVDDD